MGRKRLQLNRIEMAEMAGISVRSLFNYKASGVVTAFKVKGKNRILFDAEKTMDQLGLVYDPAATSGQQAAPASPVMKDETAPTIQEVQSKVAAVKQTLEAYVQEPATKAVQVADAKAVEQTTEESWVEYASKGRDLNTERLHKVFADQRADFLKTPKEREQDALAAKAGSLPQWQDPFS
jgi:hypothetical protein